MSNYKLIVCFAVLIACFSAKGIAQKKGEFTIGNIEVQFIRTGVEGTVLFKVFSYGKNYDKACIALHSGGLVGKYRYDIGSCRYCDVTAGR